jgi:hypothetical protein
MAADYPEEGMNKIAAMLLAWGVWVQAPAIVAMYTPAAPMQTQTIGGQVTVLITATDATPNPDDIETGIAWVEFWADSTLVRHFNTPPYSMLWDTKTLGNGAHTLLAKASDNAMNIGQASLPVTILNSSDIVAPAVTIAVQMETQSYSLWPATATPQASTPDTRSLEFGVKFKSDVNGAIAAIRFFKGVENTGVHTVSLWTSAGTLMNWAIATNETASGWQQVNFASPVAIQAGQTYVASYHANAGYSYTCPYFGGPYDNPPLHVLADGGMVAVSSQPTFPTGTYATCNWWVDVVFN